MNSWTLLILAGLLEICWAVGLKSTDGFTKLWPSVFVGSAVIASFVLLSLAMKQLPVGTAYAVWVGIGAAGAAIVAVFLHGEAMTPARALFLGLLVVAIIGLKLTSTAH